MTIHLKIKAWWESALELLGKMFGAYLFFVHQLSLLMKRNIHIDVYAYANIYSILKYENNIIQIHGTWQFGEFSILLFVLL